MAQGERTICLGYMNERGQVHLIPNGESERIFQSNESLCILRRQSKAALRGEGVNANMNNMLLNKVPQYSKDSTFHVNRNLTQSIDLSTLTKASSNHEPRIQEVRTSTLGEVYFSSAVNDNNGTKQSEPSYREQLFSLLEDHDTREEHTGDLSGSLVDNDTPVRVINKRTNNPQTPSISFTSPQIGKNDTNMSSDLNEFVSPSAAATSTSANNMNLNSYQRLNAEYDSDADGSDSDIP